MQFILNIPLPAFLQRFVDMRRRRRLAVTTFAFKGWKDAELAKKYSNDLATYDREISAGRADIRYPSGLVHVVVHDARGTIDLVYLPDIVAREYAKKFFDEAGLLVE